MASLAGPITKNAAPVTEALYMGCLKAMRTPTEMSRFDAVINLSCKTVSLPLGGACEAYCSVLVPDVEDEALVLPKLVYATRWVVEQVCGFSQGCGAVAVAKSDVLLAWYEKTATDRESSDRVSCGRRHPWNVQK